MTRWNARLATLALLASTLLAGSADAAAVQSYLYSTTGTIAGIDPTVPGYPIHFIPQTETGMLSTPGTIVLGAITTNPLPTGATLTYNNTPFSIDLGVGAVPSSGPLATSGSFFDGFVPTYLYQISGVLNGSLQDGSSTLFPTITSIIGTGAVAPFSIADLKFNLQGIAAPHGAANGSTTLTATVDVAGTSLPEPTPEPTSVAAFAVALAGWAWNRRRRTAPRGTGRIPK